jgi:hypothetical protein
MIFCSENKLLILIFKCCNYLLAIAYTYLIKR